MNQPTPDEMKAGVAGVFDRAAGTYDQVGVDFFAVIGQRLVNLADPRPGERVLDLGCGRGASAVPAAIAVGPSGSVLAIDLAPAMVAAVKVQMSAAPWLSAEVGDAEDPPPGTRDIVLASLLLFFLPNLGDAVRRYRALLAPDGRLAFSWFGKGDDSWDDIDEATWADVPKERRIGRGLPEHGPFADPTAMATFLGAAGFTDIRTETHPITVSFADPEHYWRWQWSQGNRYVLELLEQQGDLDRTLARVTSLLEHRLTRQADLRWTTEVRYTLASA